MITLHNLLIELGPYHTKKNLVFFLWGFFFWSFLIQKRYVTRGFKSSFFCIYCTNLFQCLPLQILSTVMVVACLAELMNYLPADQGALAVWNEAVMILTSATHTAGGHGGDVWLLLLARYSAQLIRKSGFAYCENLMARGRGTWPAWWTWYTRIVRRHS